MRPQRGLRYGRQLARQEKAGEEEVLVGRIREIHTDSPGAYGALRITRKLRDQGHVVNRKRVARIMREHEIAGITRRKSRSLTKQDRTAPPAPDLIQRDFTAPMPGLKLVGDITCLPTAEGWLYLATVIDLCTREVVGWSLADHMRTELVVDAVRMAHTGGHTAGNAIFHSDRGSQYTSHQFWALLVELDMRHSTGRTGSCFDNAATESFFAVLKAEIGTTVWASRSEARQDVFRWIADHYNRELIHSTIGYITPHQARTRCHQRLDLAA
ncbi:IS3 family transposase [Actinacidiphila sp. ITFR-21]|uniref:IS3 family transposase n=1 Tax=Actinacidiphila sp. ITFR-21 TaxID=3075199 RepID=UPI00288B9558|nr:IS3 family transposase [Streptomyces sp. ITFR-21]WNI20062.1 IS3 family transposase [Streptomyces sp. ITFR-21]